MSEAPEFSPAPRPRHCNGPFQDAVVYAAQREINLAIAAVLRIATEEEIGHAVQCALEGVAARYRCTTVEVRTWLAWAASEARTL